MNLFEGLFLYEIVLLFLGVLLFLVLVFVLVYYVLKKRAIKGLLFFFSIPIIMIGFPGIQKVKFDNGVVEIEKGTEKMEQNPSDTTGRSALRTNIAELEKRPVSSPGILVNVARAHAAAGDTLKALTYVDSALKANPGFQEALTLQKRYRRLHIAPSSFAR
jgi:hypothetical protein